MATKTSTVIKVEKFLLENKSNIKIVHLDESARSAQEAANSLNTSVGSIIKSLLFKVNDMGVDYPVMALISGDKKGNEKQILLSSGYKGKLSRPNAEYVKKITGFSIGGVSPLTISKNIPMLIDDSLKRFDLLWGSAGHTHWVFPISFSDLTRLTNGRVIKNLTMD